MSVDSIIRAFALATSLFAASATLAHAGPLSNVATVEQEGRGNAGAITQTGNANDASLYQFGYNNTGTINQTGNGNAACLIQYGAGQSGVLTQSGDNQNLGVLQTGAYGTRFFSADQCERRAARRAAAAAAAQARVNRSGLRR
jgi:hypothetical protein